MYRRDRRWMNWKDETRKTRKNRRASRRREGWRRTDYPPGCSRQPNTWERTPILPFQSILPYCTDTLCYAKTHPPTRSSPLLLPSTHPRLQSLLIGTEWSTLPNIEHPTTYLWLLTHYYVTWQIIRSFRISSLSIFNQILLTVSWSVSHRNRINFKLRKIFNSAPCKLICILLQINTF